VALGRVEVAPILERAAASLVPLAEKHAIELKVEVGEGDLAVNADATRLSQAVINLVSNAIKYNRPGGLVRISAEAQPEGRTRISILDSGIGIPPRRQRELFQPFNRLDAEHGTVEGSGIGLPLSKRLVELMGGQLGFESTPGVGSRFWIDLPAHNAAAASPVMEAQGNEWMPPLRGGGLVVLYIDDRPENFRMMRGIIESMAGGRMIEATSMALGVELALAYRPDLILVDLDAPDLDGGTIVQQLHGAPETAEIPVVMLSVRPASAESEEARSRGAGLVLAKPLRVHELFRIIGPIAQRRHVASARGETAARS